MATQMTASPKPFLRKVASSNVNTYVSIENSPESPGAPEILDHKLSPKLLHWTRLLALLITIVLLGYLLIDSPVVKPDICTVAAVPNRPPTQYALMIDAGSTGSRIHVYKFNFCEGSLPTLETEVFEQVKPGLSSFEEPIEAANSLRPLLELAMLNVPETMRSCTPVQVKATAGLRLLGNDKSQAILYQVTRLISKNYPFKLDESDGVVVMDGSDEGVFAWITVNYLGKTIGSSSKQSTAGIMDLGGASTQIVFEPNDPSTIGIDHKHTLNFGDHTYQLYQHSYLGYGLGQARLKIKTAAVEKGVTESFPCLSEGVQSEFKLDDHTHTLMGKSAKNKFVSCVDFITQNIFSKENCSFDSCSFDGIQQPSITNTFHKQELFAFSYFYDKTHPFGLSDRFNISSISQVASKVCVDTGIYENVEDSSDLCLDLAFIHSLLAVGYEINGSRELSVTKKIQGYETGWCLGASIYLLNSFFDKNYQCSTSTLKLS